MWFDELLANWESASVVGLGTYLIVKDIISRLPSFSLRRKLEQSTSVQLKSSNVVFGKIDEAIKLVHDVIKENGVKTSQFDLVVKENYELKSIITTMLVNTNIPLAQKETWYKAVKSIEGIATQAKDALGQHIDLEKRNQLNQVQYDNTLDQELDTV